MNTVPDLDKATALERDESSSRSIFLFEHDLFGKPVPTFPDHALVPGITNRYCSPSFETATEPVMGAHSRDPLVTSSQDEVGDISAAVGWAKRSVPTIQDRDHISGGHGASAPLPTQFAHTLSG